MRRTPTYDEWVAYWFGQGYADFFSEADERRDRFINMHPRIVAAHFLRLIDECEQFVDRFDDDEIGDFIWSACGRGPEYLPLCGEVVALSTRVEFMQAVPRLFRNLFDRVCCRRGTDPDGDYCGINEKLDNGVFMIWDMGLGDRLMRKRAHDRIVQAGLQSLDEILMSSRTTTCQLSALHGLGHMARHRPEPVQALIDGFLRDRDVTRSVRAYAQQARVGGVQ